MELLGFGPPGLLAFLALVWEQIVISRNAVHGGGERISVQPAFMKTVGQVACWSHETFRSIEHDQPKPNGNGQPCRRCSAHRV
jgi:hypothetical protein